MKQLLMTLFAGLALCSCAMTATAPADASSTAPAFSEPLRATDADEQGVKLAFDGYDSLLSAVDLLVAAKVIEPGSARALQIQRGLVVLKGALNAFASAQRAGNADSYQAAFVDARHAFEEVRTLIQETRK